MQPTLLLLSNALLVLAGIVYGVKFLRKRNYLCGIEWLIMATSGTNFFLWALSGWGFGYDIAHFFDAFSRSFGFPVVAVAGMMVVTHQYAPSRLADVLYFLLGFAGAAVLVVADRYPDLAVYKAIFYMVTGAVFVAYLAYFAARLRKAGETLHAVGAVLVAVTSLAIGILYDFVPLPGDDADRTWFYTAALTVWSFLMIELYYAYCALERATQAEVNDISRAPLDRAGMRPGT